MSNILRGVVTWFSGSIVADMTIDSNDNHVCEPYTYDKWMCIYCGAVFNRVPICKGCYEDPEMKEHECEFGSAIVEGYCAWANAIPETDFRELSSAG